MVIDKDQALDLMKNRGDKKSYHDNTEAELIQLFKDSMTDSDEIFTD